MAVIRNVRGGTVGWNEDDRLKMASLLIKAGYTVRIAHVPIEGDPKKKKEYVIEYVEGNAKDVRGALFVELIRGQDSSRGRCI